MTLTTKPYCQARNWHEFFSYIYIVSICITVLHKEIPFLRICVAICAGIISGLYLKPGPSFYIAAGIIIAVLFLFSFKTDKYSDNLCFGTALSLSLFITGLVLYRNEKESLTVLEPELSVFRCELSDYPEEKPGSILLKVRLKSRTDNSGSYPLKGSMLLYRKRI